MHKSDSNKVVFFSKQDMAGGLQLEKGEVVLRSKIKARYTDINEVLELYHIKKYIDNNLFLKIWSTEDVDKFKLKVSEFAKVIGDFWSKINSNNFNEHYQNLISEYVESFWELTNDQSSYKRISKSHFENILSIEPHLIRTILKFKKIVTFYSNELRNFLLAYQQSTELLLSKFEVKDDFNRSQLYFPKSLTLEDKEEIVSRYLDSNNVNINYVHLIENIKKRADFTVSDKTRLKAKRLYKSEREKIFENNGAIAFGISVGFRENMEKIKDAYLDNENTIHYSYSIGFIEQNNEPYNLYRNFKILFEYVDIQNRVNLISKMNDLSILERVVGVNSKNEYKQGTTFNMSEMTSLAQVAGYSNVISSFGSTMEKIFHEVLTISLNEKYSFATNVSFSIPSVSSSYFEKVRFLAPEFESILKQFKLFVQDGSIDFELLQMSSAPSSINSIPSLNQNKYIYLNHKNEKLSKCSYFLFSDQAHLAYVDPYKKKNYRNLYQLLVNEEVEFRFYEDFQSPQLNYLIDNELLLIDASGFIDFKNPERVMIMYDLFEHEVASFYHYDHDFQDEAEKMKDEDMISFESSLFSKPEQAYFNYLLNKSEFTNGVDLRNSYLHGTQAGPNEKSKHEYAYFTYLKLLFLVLLKIEDDLSIYKFNEAMS